MIQPYYCKVCGKLDPVGISGHASGRCQKVVPAMVVNKPMVVNTVVNAEPVVVNKVTRVASKPRSKDRHKQARLEYARQKMREYRARLKAK